MSRLYAEMHREKQVLKISPVEGEKTRWRLMLNGPPVIIMCYGVEVPLLLWLQTLWMNHCQSGFLL